MPRPKTPAEAAGPLTDEELWELMERMEHLNRSPEGAAWLRANANPLFRFLLERLRAETEPGARLLEAA